jgi:hypothetical protein
VTTEVFAPGGYRFIPAVFQYSAGAAAEPGYAIERVTFYTPIPLRDGFARIAELIRARGRPLQAFCACELRSPAPMSDAEFRSFNEGYVTRLAAWDIYDASSGRNPVARSNVCPQHDAPAEPSVHAFSFTVRGEGLTEGKRPTFVVAGSGEAREGGDPYRTRTVRYGETTTEALREKASFVVAEMERRLRRLGAQWTDTTATQAYTVHDLHPLYGEVIAARGAARAGLTWHLCRPPVAGLEFEMDCRGVAAERCAP